MAAAIPVASIRCLTGTAADLASPVYARLKSQMAAAKSMDERWKWLYLMGRKEDGAIFFFVDSESDDDETASPAGQVYDEATPLLRSLFDSRQACVEGPETDRWGTWVSPLVPISDSRTGRVVAVLGIDVDAGLWSKCSSRSPCALLWFGAALVSLFVVWGWLRLFRGLHWRRGMYVDVGGVAGTGVLLAACLCWLDVQDSRRQRVESFQTLARLRADHVLDELRDLEWKDLPSFASFFAGSAEVTPEEFGRYAEGMSKSAIVCSWGWVPSASSPGEGAVGEGTAAGTSHSPGRACLHAGECSAVGHDPLAWQDWREAALAARRTGLATATEPGELRCTDPPGRGFLVVLPTHGHGTDGSRPEDIAGCMVAAVSGAALARVLGSGALALPDGTPVTVELVRWHAGADHAPVVADAANPSCAGRGDGPLLAHVQPLFAFGKTYAIRTCAPPRAAAASGLGAVTLLPLAGLLATLTAAGLVAILERGWQRLRRTADERTVELRRSIARNNELALHSRTFSWEVDAEGLYTFVGETIEHLLGYRPEELVGAAHYYDLHPEEGRDEFARRTHAAMQAKEPLEGLENPILAQDGRIAWVVTNGVPVVDVDGMLLGYRGTDQDITEERRIRLREQFRMAFRKVVADVSASLVVLKDDQLDAALEQALHQVGELFGARRVHLFSVSPDGCEISGTHEWCAEGVAPLQDCLQRIPALPDGWFVRTLASGEPVHVPDTERPPGEIGDSGHLALDPATRSLLCLPIRSAEGGLVGFAAMGFASGEPAWEADEISLLRVLTEVVAGALDRRRAARALVASEEKYRLLTEGMRDVVWLADVETMRYLYVSPAAEAIFGFAPGEALQMRVADTMAEAERARWRELVRERVEGLKDGRSAFGEYYAHEMQIGRKDGSMVWAEVVVCYRLNRENGHIEMHGVARDISERKRAEEEREELQRQLIQAQKMESLGRLAGGVAHDFNNMLQAILGYTEMAMEQAEVGGRLYRDIEEIQKTVDRSANMTRQLLAFARRQTVLPRVVDLNDVVVEMLGLLRRLIGEEIRLVWTPGQDLWRASLDTNQVGMMLTNLCVNARDAMDGSGTITIESHNVDVDAAYCARHATAKPGEYVVLAVSDCGCGIDKAIIERIFDPFFTTKEVDKGTGLGLATVYGIAAQNGGFVNVYSEPGQGTTFRVYFPRHEGDGAVEPKRIAERAGRGGSETILVVEDEPTLLDMCGETLGRLGYDVLLASLPAQALALARQHGTRIRLLLTDVVMPEMNGRQLANEVAAMVPGVRCLYMSGYPEAAISHHGILEEGFVFLQKPFSRSTLAAKVREVIDASADPTRAPAAGNPPAGGDA